jgi:hypothetical protein
MRILILLVFAISRIFAAQDVWTGVERVVVVGDVHGDNDALVSILRSAGLIDQRGRWTGGKTHLVQLGDLLDRGPDSRKAMDLLMALEKQAAKAGGAVHALIGNHEGMNLYGDLRYTSPQEFAAFRTQESADLRDAFWEEQVKAQRTKSDGESRRKWEAEHPLGWIEHRQQFGPEGTYGRWIRSHLAVVKINDSIYVHGGISPKYAAMTIAQINQEISAELKDLSKITEGSAVTGEDGPLWYRGLALGDTAELSGHVENLLRTYGVKRVVVGHTTTAGAVIPRFGGKVVLAGASLSTATGGARTCVILEPDKIQVLYRGQSVLFPVDEGVDYLRYLKQVVALEPGNLPLAEMAKRVEAGLAKAK